MNIPMRRCCRYRAPARWPFLSGTRSRAGWSRHAGARLDAGRHPRPLIEHVREAEWTPDGSDLAIVRRVGGFERWSFRSAACVPDIRLHQQHPLFSPGDLIAFADHPFFADDSGAVSVVNRQGTCRCWPGGFNSVRGVAWSPDGRGGGFRRRRAQPAPATSLLAASLAGRQRVLYTGPHPVQSVRHCTRWPRVAQQRRERSSRRGAAGGRHGGP